MGGCKHITEEVVFRLVLKEGKDSKTWTWGWRAVRGGRLQERSWTGGWVRVGEGPASSSVRGVEGGQDSERPVGLTHLHRVSPRVLARSELWFPWISPEDMVYRWTLDWSLCKPQTQPDPGFSRDKQVL